ARIVEQRFCESRVLFSQPLRSQRGTFVLQGLERREPGSLEEEQLAHPSVCGPILRIGARGPLCAEDGAVPAREAVLVQIGRFQIERRRIGAAAQSGEMLESLGQGARVLLLLEERLEAGERFARIPSQLQRSAQQLFGSLRIAQTGSGEIS